MKIKTCKWCKAKFTPERIKQFCCSIDCAHDYGKKLTSRQEAIAIASSRAIKVKGIADHRKEAQAALNAFVRADEETLPCISCGTTKASQWHAGHYLSVGAHPEMRYMRANIHKQCSKCNTHLHGNLIEYRKGLISRYGIEYVEMLESKHPMTKYTIEDLIGIKNEYKQKLKELNK